MANFRKRDLEYGDDEKDSETYTSSIATILSIIGATVVIFFLGAPLMYNLYLGLSEQFTNIEQKCELDPIRN
jgi:hypothetical protein